MSEQAVKLVELVPSDQLDTAVGEQAHGRMSFVNAAGAPVDVAAGAVIPPAPATDGTYALQVTVAAGEASYEWVAVTGG